MTITVTDAPAQTVQAFLDAFAPPRRRGRAVAGQPQARSPCIPSGYRGHAALRALRPVLGDMIRRLPRPDGD